jgi:hypothetical protein
MKMLELAQECKQLQVFTHVSTAYVNCNRPGGNIEEDIYDLDIDVEETVARLMAMNPQEVQLNEKTLIGNYPNTYTYTKSMAEKSLMKKKGNIQCVLFRPSIIASAEKEPFPGWTDSLSAAGGVTLMCSLGLINYVKVPDGGKNVFDVVPVDIVSNGIIVSTAHAGQKPDNELDIYNCGTSSLNPCTIIDYREVVAAGNKYFAFNKKVFPMNVNLITNPTELKLKIQLFNTLPLKLLEITSKLPIIGNKSM